MFKNTGVIQLVRLVTGENIIARFIFNEEEPQTVKMIDPMIVYILPPDIKSGKRVDSSTIEGALVRMFLGPYPTSDLVMNSEYILNGDMIVTISENVNPTVLEGYHKIVRYLSKTRNEISSSPKFYSSDMQIMDDKNLKDVESKLGDINSPEYKNSLELLNNALSSKSLKNSKNKKNNKKKDDDSEAA